MNVEYTLSTQEKAAVLLDRRNARFVLRVRPFTGRRSYREYQNSLHDRSFQVSPSFRNALQDPKLTGDVSMTL